MSKRRFKRMEVPDSFRRLVFDFKSENPDKNIPDILDDMARFELARRKKLREGKNDFKYF